MNEHISKISNYITAMESIYLGYALGAATFIVAIILVKIIKAAFSYPRKSPGVKIPGENGSLYITSKAIADLVRTMETGYLKVTKVTLWENKKFLALEINTEFDLKGGSLPLIGENFKKDLLEKLKTHFGIDSIRDIDITNKKASEKSNSKF